MLNNLSKKLLIFLETIYEEVPHKITIKDLRSYIKAQFNLKKDKNFDYLLNLSIDERYISIMGGEIFLQKAGIDKLFELRKYFSYNSSKKARVLPFVSIIIALLVLLSSTIPSSPKVYWSQGNSCPTPLYPGGVSSTFRLDLNNYGQIPSLITLNASGNGIGIDNNLNFSNSFTLPPTSISGGYSHNFIISLINMSKENLSFNFSYHYTTYFMGFIPIMDTYLGKTFNCCYKKEKSIYQNYNLVDCNTK